MKKFRLFLIVAAGLALAQPYDLVIRNGHIIDGTGSPWYSGDIAIQGGRVAAIGQLRRHAETKADIDAHGLVVAPGFIDMLGQSELTILVNPHLPSKIFQGITTEITGEGNSIAPLNDAIANGRRARLRPLSHHAGLDRPSASTSRGSKSKGMGINLASYVGATQVRRHGAGRRGSRADCRANWNA